MTTSCWSARARRAAAELDLQINPLAEHDGTELTSLAKEMAMRQGIKVGRHELAQPERDVAPEQVAQEVEDRERWEVGHLEPWLEQMPTV